MSGLKFSERILIWQLASGRAGRAGLAGVLGSPILRWRYGAPIAEEILLVPQELRGTDPSFATELSEGQMGLAGRIGRIGKSSPFRFPLPDPGWARELHGFSWLRHLRAAATDEASEAARTLVAQWLAHAPHPDLARDPAITARRIISWLSNADLLLVGVNRTIFDRTAQSLADETIRLSSAWRKSAEGYPRLLALIGLVYADLCIAGHTRHLARAEQRLAAELRRQILTDGGHISRDADVLVELMLDLLPLRQCFATAGRTFPAEIETSMTRMMRMMRYLRLGDGSLSRFNGVGKASLADVACVLGYAGAQDAPLASAPHSRYARLEQGPCIVIADAGITPPLVYAGKAMAGCLSFELSIGPNAVFVNGGWPGAESKHLATARSTASHNTLSLGDKSSARRLPHDGLARIAGGEPLVFDGFVSSTRPIGGGGEELQLSHTGFRDEHGVVHSRRLRLPSGGERLEGRDLLAGPRRALRLKQDVPFAIRFHLSPSVVCEQAMDGVVDLRLRDGSIWRFEAAGADLSTEPSMHYADTTGPARSQQIVLRGACFGETEVSWSLEKTGL